MLGFSVAMFIAKVRMAEPQHNPDGKLYCEYKGMNYWMVKGSGNTYEYQ